MENKKRLVREKFTSIAGKYDFLNTIFSFGNDKRWRKQAVENLGIRSGGRYLDFCAGTLPLCATIFETIRIPIKVVAYDFCIEMLREGSRGFPGLVKDNRLEIIAGDGEHISFKKNTYDGAIVCFGLRNLVNMDKGLEEIARTLKPGAKLVSLEFSNEISPLIKPFYRLYLEKIMPLVGGIVSGNRDAYLYLAGSIKAFSKPEELKSKFIQAGFKEVHYTPLTCGIAYIHVGIKG